MAEKKKLSAADFLASLKKSKNSSFASEGVASGEIENWYDTGCLVFNLILSGSIFKGLPPRVVALAGEEATGKTYIAMSIMEQFLKQEGALVEVWDTESTMNRDNLSARNIDPKKVIISEEQTVEEFSNSAYQRLLVRKQVEDKERVPYLMVLDSLGGLSSTKALTDMEKDNITRDMTKSGALKQGMIAINKQAALTDVPVIVTNHVYKDVMAYGAPNKMGGGSGLKYMASIIIMLSKKNDWNDKTKKSSGIFITAKAEKSRFIKPSQKVQMYLSYTKGLDRYYGLLALAEEFELVATKQNGNKGKSYTFGNAWTANAKEIYANPTKYFDNAFLKAFDEQVSPNFRFGGTSTDEEFPDDEEVSDEG